MSLINLIKKLLSEVITTDEIYEQDELQHYGVVGMRWGVRKAQRKIERNTRLEKVALDYDKRAAKYTKKSERVHAREDLGGRNKHAILAANYNKQAAILRKTALKTADDVNRSKMERRATKLEYKAAKEKIAADRISKTTGYSAKAMKYAIKSDEMARYAARSRKKIANNEAYIQMMDRKVASLTKEELSGAYSFVNEYMKR